VEQRIGSSSQPLKGEPVKGAGFDPAFIPGITAPAAGDPADTKPADADTEDAEAIEDSKGLGAVDGDIDADADADPGSGSGAEAEEVPDGPVFEASDRRARIVADHKGVRLALDDQECEFRWDEVGAVETETPRFGKRFTVTVHTPDRRWYPIEIEADSRSRFTEWEGQLDAVLDAYFEDGESESEDPAAADADEKAADEKAAAETEDKAEAKAEDTTEAKVEAKAEKP